MNLNGARPATNETVQGRVVVLNQAGGKVCGVTSWMVQGEEIVEQEAPETTLDGSVGKALASLARTVPQSWVIWHQRPLGSVADQWERDLVARLVALPRHRLELWHAGLDAKARERVRTLGYVDFDDAALVGGLGGHGSWLVSGRCGIAHCSLFSRIPWGDGSGCATSSWLDFGRRVSRSGCLCLVEPTLDGAGEGFEMEPDHKVDLALMIARCYGERWVRFWHLARLLFGPGRLAAIGESLVWVGRRRRVINQRAGGGCRVDPPLSGQPKATNRASESPSAGRLLSKGFVSVVIPSVGREASLSNVLLDLERQNQGERKMAVEVIVVEQMPDGAEPYDPSLFEGHSYPCTHRTVPWVGAGRARNLGATLARGDWILFLDDDVGFGANFLGDLLEVALRWSAGAMCAAVVTPSAEDRRRLQSAASPSWDQHSELVERCLEQHRTSAEKAGILTWSWSGLAGGAALVRREAVQAVNGFDERLDQGYGEDYEFGVRLRLAGQIVLSTNEVALVHLHAPAGGFRALEGLNWDGGEEPKPSPYVLLSRDGLTLEMQRSYQLVYVLRCLFDAARRSLFGVPLQTFRVLRRLRSSHRWKKRFSGLSRGGLGSASGDQRSR